MIAGQICEAGDDLANHCKEGNVVLRGVITKVIPRGKEGIGKKTEGLITLLFKAEEAYPASETGSEYCIAKFRSLQFQLEMKMWINYSIIEIIRTS